MRKFFRTLGVVLAGAIGVAVLAVPAAATFTTPSTNPFTVPGDGSGNPLPFDVVVSGFPASTPVFAEICDGTPSSAAGWDPTINCDLGSAGSSTTSNGSGVATFPANDVNKHVNPFKGPSPQGFFNCIAPGESDPNNGLPTFTNCQLRVSTNNTAGTTDQQFLTLTMPTGGTPVTPEVPYAVILPIGGLVAAGGFFIIRKRRAGAQAAA